MRQRIRDPRLAALALALASHVVAATSPAAAQTRSPMNIQRPKPAESPELVVLFEGGDYPANIARVLQRLAEKGVLATTTVRVEAGQTICALYGRALRSGCTRETLALAQALNPPDASSRRALKAGSLTVGHEVTVPSVQLTERPYFVKLDPRVGSDRQRIADLTANWTKVDQKELPDGYVGYTFPGFELRVPARSDEEAEALRRELRLLRVPNITVAARVVRPPAPPLHASIDPARLWEHCVDARGTLPAQEEGDLRLMLSAAPPRTCPVACQGDLCPDVVLVDTTVWRHPELDGFLDADPGPCPGTPTPTPAAGPPADCRLQDIDERIHHGTHLAGIVAARADGRGVSGIAPETRITSVCWPTDVASLNTFMSHRGALGGQTPIYLFASEFPWTGPDPTKDGDRLSANRNPYGASIVALRDLWVVAAGNGDRPQEYAELSYQSKASPADLGDQENVVVVTACEDCFLDSARLAGDANRSTPTQRLVHVAAPGEPVMSPCTEREYGRAHGTSQASAFVAGVAAAMKACYPSAYLAPSVVKTRLQTTSRPFASRQDGVAAGVVDLDTALLDPKTDWLRTGRQPWAAVRVKRWLSAFEMKPLGATSLRMSDVLRLTRLGPDTWSAYARFPDDASLAHRAEVVRFGPGQLAHGDGMDGDGDHVLELCDGSTVRLADLDDLLLAMPVGFVERGDTCR
jgi:hypothetical protein